MARNLEPSCRQCRAAGKKLFLKGERCYSESCAIERRNTPPGPRRRRGKPSDFSRHLNEKQTGRHTFGIMERQFRNYFIKAKKIPGVTGDELLRLLERRLDNVVYRLKLASSRKQARQLVNHRHIWVNGRVVDLPSYIVRVGDEIQVKESRQQKPYFKTIKENARTPAADYWLALDTQTLKGKVLRLPTVEEMESTFNPHLVVEYYSNQV